MKKEMFDELLESVKEAGAVLRGEKEPSREFHPPDPPQRSPQFAVCVSKTELGSLTFGKVYESF